MILRLRKIKSAYNKSTYAAIVITSAFTLIHLRLLTHPNLSSTVSPLQALEREASGTFTPGPSGISDQASSKKFVFLFMKAQL